MLTMPSIDESKLKDFLEETYNISISHIKFLPKGETSWAYIIEAENEKFFLKVYKEKFAYLEEATQLTGKLYTDCGIQEIVYAIKSTSGKTVYFFESYPIVLFNFIEGKEIAEQKLTDKQVEEMGKIIGRIHTATAKIGNYPKRETFKSKDIMTFLKIIERIKHHQPNENPYQKQLVDLFMGKRELIVEQLTMLEKLGKTLRLKLLPFVICHSDPTPGNILIGSKEELYVIDWDTPILAPKERDLVFFDDRMEIFMKGYSQLSKDTKIDNDAKQFYLLEWNVQEVADYGERILFQSNSEEQNKHDLEGLIEFLGYSGIGA